MAVITVYGKTPDVGSAAFVAPNATLAGGCCAGRWQQRVVRRGGARRYRRHPHWQKQQYPGQRRAAHRAKPGGNDRQKCIHRPQCSGAWLYGGGRRFDRYARHGDERRRGGQKCRGGRRGAGAGNTVVPDGMVAMGVPAKVREAASLPWWKPTEKSAEGYVAEATAHAEANK